jgi:hypothetical protein
VLSCSGPSFAAGVSDLEGTGVEDINLLLGTRNILQPQELSNLVYAAAVGTRINFLFTNSSRFGSSLQ